MTLKAIETLYKGYRFRSRLEARWAVFFDAVGADWKYEVEGYQLPSGWYLPDFIVYGKFFVEIKPGPPPRREPSDPPKELILANELMKLSRKSAYIFYGDPVEALEPSWPGVDGFMFLGQDDDPDDPYLHPEFLYVNNDRLLRNAALKARQARFEHGETPA